MSGKDEAAFTPGERTIILAMVGYFIVGPALMAAAWLVWQMIP